MSDITFCREIYTFHGSESDRSIIECLFVVDSSCIPEEMDGKGVRVIQVNPEVIRKISGVQSIDSVELIALMRIPSTFRILNNGLNDEDLRTLLPFPRRILVLDGIQVRFTDYILLIELLTFWGYDSDKTYFDFSA